MGVRMSEKDYKSYISKKKESSRDKNSLQGNRVGISTLGEEQDRISSNSDYITTGNISQTSNYPRRVEFQLPIKITSNFSLNSVYSGEHWAKRKSRASYIHNLVYQEMKRQKVQKKVCTRPVMIEILYNSNLDIDNHGYLSKLIIDGMKGYLIQEDNRKYVIGLIQRFKSGHGITVRVEEIEDEKVMMN